MCLETREAATGINSHLRIKIFGNPPLKSYKGRTNEFIVHPIFKSGAKEASGAAKQRQWHLLTWTWCR
jgi:hypothetical protein